MNTPASQDLSRQDPIESPSKSERKRTAHAAQDLGEALIGMRPRELEALGLPEALLEAVGAARRIRSRAAAARQRQYIGKLMRRIDPEPIRLALLARTQEQARQAQRFHRAEAWRRRLLEEGESALDELSRLKPDLDLRRWRRLVSAARQSEPASSPTARTAGRELFRALRALLG